MKKIGLFVLFIFLFCLVNARTKTNFSSYRGVWSNDYAEAVITDSICIFYCKEDSTMKAYLEIPTAGISSNTVFSKDGTITTTSSNPPLDILKKNGGIVICGQSMKKVEEIQTVKPYEMPQCHSKFDIGKCLQYWRLGSQYEYDMSDGNIYCEINTNRHMFIYMVSSSITYFRAAATRNNNLGTLFFQNIRMMKNNNSGEYTMYIHPHNYTFTKSNIEIDDSKYNPNSCVFDLNGGIYWSFISSEPDLILLNGCGETYNVKRPRFDSKLEYIKYVTY